MHARTELRAALEEKITTTTDAKRRRGREARCMSTLQTSFYDGPALIDRVSDALREADSNTTSQGTRT